MRAALPAYPRALISDLSPSEARGLRHFYGAMGDPISARFRNLDIWSVSETAYSRPRKKSSPLDAFHNLASVIRALSLVNLSSQGLWRQSICSYVCMTFWTSISVGLTLYHWETPVSSASLVSIMPNERVLDIRLMGDTKSSILCLQVLHFSQE